MPCCSCAGRTWQWGPTCTRRSVGFALAGALLMPCLCCASCLTRRSAARVPNCTLPSLTWPRPTTRWTRMRCGAFCACTGYHPKLLSFWRICTPGRWLRLGWGGPWTGVLGGQRGAPGLHCGGPAIQRIPGLCNEAGLGKHATRFWGVDAIPGRWQPTFLVIPGNEPYAGVDCTVAICRRHGVFFC